jgi:hypothetical protein
MAGVELVTGHGRSPSPVVWCVADGQVAELGEAESGFEAFGCELGVEPGSGGEDAVE